MAKGKNGKNTSGRIKIAAEVVTLGLALGGVVVSLFNYALLNRLQPMDARISAVEHLEPTLATKDQMTGISGQLEDLKTELHTFILFLKGK